MLKVGLRVYGFYDLTRPKSEATLQGGLQSVAPHDHYRLNCSTSTFSDIRKIRSHTYNNNAENPSCHLRTFRGLPYPLRARCQMSKARMGSVVLQPLLARFLFSLMA